MHLRRRLIVAGAATNVVGRYICTFAWMARDGFSIRDLAAFHHGTSVTCRPAPPTQASAPPSRFQAMTPPSMWRAPARPASCAAMAERFPAAQ